MAGEEVVGGIVGFLRLDADDFHREITKALAEIKVLSSADAKVHVEATGVGSTERDLLKVATAAKAVDGNVNRMGKSFGGRGMMSAPVIVSGIAAGMALLGPVTGAATAALGGFVGVAGTAALAFVGFKDEIAKGSALGQVLQSQLDGIKNEFKALGATAASAMSGDVLSGLSEIRRFLPTINPQVEALAGHLGRAFKTSATGVVSGLDAMMPLLEDGGRYAEIMANKFADFAQSQQFKDFIDYARRELPNVGQAILSLVGGVKDLAVALAPVGDDLIEIIHVTGQTASAVAPLVGWLSQLAHVANAGYNPVKQAAIGIDWMGKSATDATDAIDEHTSHLLTLQSAQSPLAASLGITNEALKTATDVQRDAAKQAADATTKMQLEGDAAGLLKQALDQLNGKSLDLASAQTNSASATLRAISALKDHNKAGTEYGKTLSLNTEKGIAARQALEAKVRADQQGAEAEAQASGGTKSSIKVLADKKKALEDSLRAQGLLTAKVQAYIDKIYQIPKNVPPTKVEIDKKAMADSLSSLHAFQKAIDALHGKSVTSTVHYAFTGKLPNGGHSTAGGLTFKDGGKIPGYAGGTVVGPGTGTSDSILGMVAQTNRLLRVSAGEFISTNASRQRNAAALEAGNRGATLTVAGGGGTVELGPATIAALASAMSRIRPRTTVTAGQFDAAMGVRV